jgi:hypothetical protein
MTPEDWFGLFARTTGDAELLRILEAQGFPSEVPPIPSGSNDVRIEKGGLMLVFLDLVLFPDLAGGLGRGGALASMTFVVAERGRELWTGPLPFGLSASDAQADLRARFGEPTEASEGLQWDRWEIDGYPVTIKYTKDLAALRRVTVDALARTGRAREVR